MRYPIETKAIIDVTKPPYCADNTGKVDCTQILRQILDDVLIREVDNLKATHDKILKESDNGKENYYVGLETGRMQNGELWITFPEILPPTRIIYFPKGTYLVSDTITYTLENLKNFWYSVTYYENNRNIHFLGESKEETVIKLADHAEGFSEGDIKPVVSFANNVAVTSRDKEYENAAFLNTIQDITIDCGKGNTNAVGIRYSSANIGRIENVTIKAENSYCGIYTDFVAQAVFNNINISGFTYGLDTAYSMMIVLDNIHVGENQKAGIYTHDSILNIHAVNSGNIPTIEFSKGNGRYYIKNKNITFANDFCGNRVYFEEENLVPRMPLPEYNYDADDFAYVDDFGAIGDYETDSTRAIQRAMNSGKSTILFGEGQYLINAKIKIPKTVKRIDFMFCSLRTGIRLVGGEYDCAFEIAEDAGELLVMENLFTWEQFRGHIRLIKHAAKRDLLVRNVQLMTASLYFNSVPGSKVYFDNIFLTTGTYTPNAWIPGEGFTCVYSHIIPMEFHGQKVYGRQVNLERADMHILNDNSEVFLDCFRIEGPGTALKSVNGGKTHINLFNAGLGRRDAQNAVYELHDANLSLHGARFFGFNKNSEYPILVQNNCAGQTDTVFWEDTENDEKTFSAYFDHYTN